MLSIQIAKKAKKAMKALSRSTFSLVKKGASRAVRYSPRGIGDERPNVLDSRYTFPPGDEPVTLPMRPQGTAYLIAALVVAIFIAMTAAATNL